MRPRLALCVGLLALVVSALTPVCALGAAPATREATVQRSWLRGPSTAAAKAKTAAGPRSKSFGPVLAGLLLVALASGALYQRWRRRQTARAARLSHIQVMSATRVGPKAQLVIASVGSRVLLLGVTESQVTKLEWLDESLDGAPDADAEEVPAALAPRNGRQGAPRGHFLSVLRDAMGTRRATLADGSTNAALELARQTRDFVSRGMDDGEKTRATGRSAKTTPAALPARSARSDRIMLAHDPEIEGIHVEGQAAGLVARLARNRP
ncbi:MAG: flagellar biosynthetic protein FliO [Polyangiaceae bacterium]|nr:flagellar biosynthetic protein FliO [Polyangiaceae bacterium]